MLHGETFKTFRGILPSELDAYGQPRKAEPKRVVAALSTKPKEETWKHSACVLAGSWADGREVINCVMALFNHRTQLHLLCLCTSSQN